MSGGEAGGDNRDLERARNADDLDLSGAGATKLGFRGAHHGIDITRVVSRGDDHKSPVHNPNSAPLYRLKHGACEIGKFFTRTFNTL